MKGANPWLINENQGSPDSALVAMDPFSYMSGTVSEAIEWQGLEPGCYLGFELL